MVVYDVVILPENMRLISWTFRSFSGSQRRNAVLPAERLQFSERVDAPQLCARLYQRPFGVLIRAEEDRRLAQCCGLHHNKWQFQQRQKRRLVRSEDFGKLWRAKSRGFHGQRVWRFKAKLRRAAASAFRR
jgi:hypothetical protein